MNYYNTKTGKQYNFSLQEIKYDINKDYMFNKMFKRVNIQDDSARGYMKVRTVKSIEKDLFLNKQNTSHEAESSSVKFIRHVGQNFLVYKDGKWVKN